MNTFAIAAVLAVGWSGPGLAAAQCLELPQLLSIGAARSAVVHPETIALLPATEWQLQRAASPTQDIVWTSVATNALGAAQAQVLLRPYAGQPTPDVLLKTTQLACARQMRATLKRQGLKPVAVTCPDCEAQRYQAAGFVATLYSGLKGDFPYLLVVHPLAPAGAAPAPSAVNRE